MAPRFINPHLLPESSTTVSRRELFDGDEEAGLGQDDYLAIEKLNVLIHASFASRHGLREDESHSRKRRKLGPLPTIEPEHPVLFRLVSTSLPPRPTTLEPKPPPPPVTREPECEDNEIQATRRHKRAQAAAVDSSWVIRESHKSNALSLGTHRKLLRADATLPTPLPVLMLVQGDQPPRATRPPVPASHLTRYPYVKDSHDIPPDSTIMDVNCPRIEVNFMHSQAPRGKRKRRRTRPAKQRPPPAFWAPNPAWGGKSLGYAMGYPCSLAAFESVSDRSVSEQRYWRDTMRTAVAEDASM